MSRFPLPALLLAAAMTAALAPGRVAAAGPGAHAQAERSQERQARDVYKAWFPDRATAYKAAISLHGALLESEYGGGWQIFELDADGVTLLQRAGYRLEPATEFLRRRDAFLDALDRAAAARGREVGTQAIPGYSCYETVEDSFAAAQAMATSRPDLATWTDIGDSWQKSVAQGGYDMRVLKLSNSAVPGPKPKLVITSAIHAREYVTAPLSLALARWLFDGYGQNADATWLMDHHEVHLILQANPDGRKKAESGLSWRKNTNTAYCGARSNSRGADLNRNFGFSWNTTNGQGSSGNQCDATYRGPSAASEPETKAIEAYIRSQFPDRRGPSKSDPAPADTAGLHLDLHSYSELVLWPWGDTASPSPNATALQTLGRRFAHYNGYMPMQSIGLYPTDGTSDGPSYGELGVPAFTFELGTSFFQDCSTYNNEILPKNLAALKYAAKIARAPYQLPAGPTVVTVSVAGGRITPGAQVEFTAYADDTPFSTANGNDPVQPIASAEYFVDTPPWMPGARPVAMTASDGAFDSPSESVRAVLNTSGLSVGAHLLYVRATDTSGATGPVTAGLVYVGVDPPPPAITLAVTSSPINRRSWDVSLRWTGVPGSNASIFRNGVIVDTTPNDGSWNETRGRGTWAYKVCVEGTQTQCSPEVSVTF